MRIFTNIKYICLGGKLKNMHLKGEIGFTPKVFVKIIDQVDVQESWNVQTRRWKGIEEEFQQLIEKTVEWDDARTECSIELRWNWPGAMVFSAVSPERV